MAAVGDNCPLGLDTSGCRLHKTNVGYRWTGPNRLLAERVESLVSQEHAKWSLAQEQVEKKKEDKK